MFWPSRACRGTEGKGDCVAQRATGSGGGRYQFGLLSIDRITKLEKGLELIVLGECDDLHYCAKLGENLEGEEGKLRLCC